MANWTPDPDFIEFLQAIVDNMKNPDDKAIGEAVMQEINSGSDVGEEMYNAFYTNPAMQMIYEEWKADKS
ncbi:MAG: hypothetical protein G01um101419_235 [Parcubacteria group bacterium Gr01-1014_19]|nr:MAG: hypothetical protein G01um101419_235 [Parcubacteria group bacterium Gr01-1014_19]